MALKEIRKQRGLTLHQLAAIVGVHFTAVHKWEKRGIPAERVLRLAAALDVDPHDLRADLYPKPAEAA